MMARNEFYLDTYTKKENLLSAIRRIPYVGSYTNTSGGLRLMMNEQFIESKGDRRNVKNIAIVLTDGSSNLDVDKTIPDAQDAQNRGIQMFSVGISDAIAQVEIKGLSSPPQEENRNYFLSTDFRYLETIRNTIVEVVCSAAGTGG